MTATKPQTRPFATGLKRKPDVTREIYLAHPAVATPIHGAVRLDEALAKALADIPGLTEAELAELQKTLEGGE